MNRNVNGCHGPWALDPIKLLKVREIYFNTFPSEDEQNDWETVGDVGHVSQRSAHRRIVWLSMEVSCV